jgi:hypothetical protein
MFKKFTLLNCLLVLVTVSYAQSLSPTVVSSAGGSDQTNNVRLDWTLGELAVETTSTLDKIYTQGFQQPLLITKVKSSNQPMTGYSVSVYPNPVRSILTINIQSIIDSKVYLKITDLKGQVVYNNNTYSKGSSVNVNMRSLASGVYLLTVTHSSGVTIGTYKIVKAP